MFASLPFKYIFILVVGFGTFFSLSSRHWLGIWAGLEINLIGFLPILVYQKRMLERESAVKYFVVQALGSRFLIFGRLLTFRLSLSWEIIIDNLRSALIRSTLLSTGLILKIGVFPFHFWFPRVIAGLGWFSCLLLSTWQKFAPIFLIITLVTSTTTALIIFLICIIGAGSRLAGGLGGLNQTQVRALLAYSSIGHIGWIIFGLCSRESSIKIYFRIYILISVCLFISLWILDSGSLKLLGSLSKSSWTGTFRFLFILLSLGGLPPLLGFISKWIIMSSSITISSWGFLFLLVLGSLISLFYYLRLFFSEILSLKGERLRPTYRLRNLGNMYINVIVLVNSLGGLILLFSLPARFL